MKLALSILCENPRRRTGLTTAYQEMVSRALHLYRDLAWLVFAGPDQEWQVEDARVEVVRRYPANDRRERRLLADHFLVSAAARDRGADALITTGFVPTRKCLPVAVLIFSLQHLDRRNQVGFLRAWYRSRASRSWPKADLAVTNSRVAAAQILELFPEMRDRLVQAYDGLRHEQFHPNAAPDEVARLKKELGMDPGYLLWVSNFYAYKQAEKLLAGYARLDPALRRQHPLLMVGGEWDGGRAAAQQQTRTLGLEADVKFPGWVGDDLLAPLFRHAALHVLPSREETFGRTVTESMACGTPVMVNDVPIMHEVTAEHAVIVNFDDPEKVAEGLRRALEDKALRTRLRAEGLVRAQDFSFEKFTKERIDAIQKMVVALKLGQKFTVFSNSPA